MLLSCASGGVVVPQVGGSNTDDDEDDDEDEDDDDDDDDDARADANADVGGNARRDSAEVVMVAPAVVQRWCFIIFVCGWCCCCVYLAC